MLKRFSPFPGSIVSVGKPEIQPMTCLISCIFRVIFTFLDNYSQQTFFGFLFRALCECTRVSTYLNSHCIPFLVTDLVLGDIVNLSYNEQCYGKNVDGNQLAISAMVSWFVVLAVDI